MLAPVNIMCKNLECFFTFTGAITLTNKRVIYEKHAAYR